MSREISFYLCDQRIYIEMAPEFNLEFAFNLFLKYRQLQRRKMNCHLNEDFDTIITLLLRKKKRRK